MHSHADHLPDDTISSNTDQCGCTLIYSMQRHQETSVSLLIPGVLSDVSRPKGACFLQGIHLAIRHLSLLFKSAFLPQQPSQTRSDPTDTESNRNTRFLPFTKKSVSFLMSAWVKMLENNFCNLFRLISLSRVLFSA